MPQAKQGGIQSQTHFLCSPLFPLSIDGKTPYRPTLKEISVEFWDALNFKKKSGRSIAAFTFASHVLTFGFFLWFFFSFISTMTFLFWVGGILFLANVFHTIWLHNYCSHKAFEWRQPYYARIVLWLNPLMLPEQGYVISHMYHHPLSDKVGDPHGPHLGYVGTYLAIESTNKLNHKISKEDYKKLKRKLSHLGICFNSYEDFRRTASAEKLSSFFLRTAFAQTLWVTLIFSLCGFPYVIAWYAAIFSFNAMFRDFGYRGHGGSKPLDQIHEKLDSNSRAINQWFYGVLASEWHDNHHLFPRSVNYAFGKGQFQLSFQIIRFLKMINVVSRYTDVTPQTLVRRTH